MPYKREHVGATPAPSIFQKQTMTTKKNNKKTVTKTLKVFPDGKVLTLLVDIAVTAMLLGTAFTMLLLCVQMAEKITISVGK